MVAAEVAQFDHMSRGRFMLGVGPGGLLVRLRVVRHTDVGVRNRKVVESVRIMQQIWSQDPPYEIDGEFCNVQLEGRDHSRARHRLHAEAVSRKAARRFRFRWRARIRRSRARRRSNGWGIISANIIPTYSVASHWAIYSKACAEAGKRASGEKWRVARNVMVAPSDAEAHDRVFGEKASNRYLFDYMRTVLARRRAY